MIRTVRRASDWLRRRITPESAGGLVLLASAIAALVFANSPWSANYFALWQTPITIGVGTWTASATAHHLINDGLMTVFFFLVGLEIKRELVAGELASLRRAALPVAAALGGMILPATLYVAVNFGGEGGRGWAIPMATDIAFALGVLSLLGRRVPPALRVFLTALAIVDDIGAVAVIALFYAEGVSYQALVVVALLLAALVAFNRLGVRSSAPYLLVGGLLWVATSLSGIHATVAGVLLAATIPAIRRPAGVLSPVVRLERRLRGPVGFIIMPLFAFANAGVSLGSSVTASLDWRIIFGVVLGLLVGKSVGITGAAWLSTKARLASLPADVSWRAVHGVGWLGGIGFTMALYIAGLAFDDGPLINSAKIGILGGSIVAGIVGVSLVRGTNSARPPRPESAR